MNTFLKFFSVCCLVFSIGMIFYAGATLNDNIFINQRTGEVLSRNQFQDMVNAFAIPIIVFSSIALTMLLINEKRTQHSFSNVRKAQ